MKCFDFTYSFMCTFNKADVAFALFMAAVGFVIVAGICGVISAYRKS